MLIGITGAAGFIGGHVVDVAVQRGHSVIFFDHAVKPTEAQIKLIDAGKAEYFLGDVRDVTAVTELAAHCNGLIHLAACLGTQETIANPRPSAETNILGSLNVFEAANQYDLPAVYAGVGNHWMREHGTGSYTISKTAAEDYVRMFNSYRNGKITIVRPVNAYGPRQSVAAPYGSSKVRKIMPAFICRALTGAPVEVYGDGTQVSDCVYVQDVAEVFVRALEHTSEYGATERPVEVGPNKSSTVNEIATKVVEIAACYLSGSSVDIIHLPMRPGEVPNAIVSADTSTLAQIGMSAENFTPLGAGIVHTVRWFIREWLPGYEASN